MGELRAVWCEWVGGVSFVGKKNNNGSAELRRATPTPCCVVLQAYTSHTLLRCFFRRTSPTPCCVFSDVHLPHHTAVFARVHLPHPALFFRRTGQLCVAPGGRSRASRGSTSPPNSSSS